MIAPCPPAAATSRAVHTCSPFECLAAFWSVVPDLVYCPRPSSALPVCVFAKLLAVAVFFPCAASQMFTVFVAPAVHAFTVIDRVFLAAQRAELLTVFLADF